MTHILIAGGGVAGLTTALALHAAGFERITVTEAARELRPVGAGLNIMPNAVRELDELGVLDALEPHAVRTRELRYYHRSGSLISVEQRGVRAGYRWPQLSVHRGALQRVLAAAVRERLGPSALLTAVRVTGADPLAADGLPRVSLDHRDGGRQGCASLAPDLLIGADGIRSAVRAALHPGEGDPPWNGQLIHRGVSRVPADRSAAFMFIAGDDRRKAVVYPLTLPDAEGTVLVNWACVGPGTAADGTAAHRGDWNRRVPPDAIARHFADWEFDGVRVGEILAAAEAAYVYPMVDRDPLPHWSRGRTTLVGDAAHAMYPVGSNGATQSVVDGRALAHALVTHRDPVAALAAYEADRLPAMTELQLANRRLGPEVVIRLAHERAPGGFPDIDAVVPPAERAGIAARYAATGAFDPASVNAGSPYGAPARGRAR
ncbi:flavin-dependent oxidoreductase [Streptomyces sanyensis]|uniref:Flavin-dependent oxidoreductase n=1 Tax=Streptomyces sanyensis TaxID=568869 RepID=A0ABP9AH85_9ACTN